LCHIGSQPFIHIGEWHIKKEKHDDETVKEVLATDIESGRYSEQNNEEYSEALQRQWLQMLQINREEDQEQKWQIQKQARE
jgi:hypothetical protein